MPHDWKVVETRHAIYVYRNTEGRQRNHYRHRKAVRITCSECAFAAFVIKRAMRMRCTVLPSVDCPALPYFTALTHKGQDFLCGGEGGVGWGILHIKRVFCCSLQILSETFLIPRRIKRDITTNVHRSSCTVPVIIVRAYEP
jgi:hypothetical protein